MSKRKYISFFSGALGLDIGLEAAGFQSLAVNEFDNVACQTIRANRPKQKLFDCDIRLLDADTLNKELNLARNELFAIVGGPPCQAFSTAGRRLGLNDDRGNVFLHFIDLIVQLRPKYAIFENVRGLLSAPLVHRPHEQRGKNYPPLSESELPGGALLAILNRLERGGYTTTFTLYNTANYGVPQVRERLIFFASQQSKGVPFIPPTHDEIGRGGLPKWKTLREAIGDLSKISHQSNSFSPKRVRFFKMLKEGQNWKNLPMHLQKEAMGESWFANGGKTGFYRRLAWDKPSPTLVTRPNMPATALCHPTKLRPLSIEEYSRIQTFPDDYIFAGKIEDEYRQIGNAVPPLFGQKIGEHLIAFDERKLVETETNGKMSRYVGTDHASWRASISRTPFLF